MLILTFLLLSSYLLVCCGNNSKQQQERLEHMLEFPEHIKKLHINIGCNLDPPMPPDDDYSVGVLAVEPVLRTAARIPIHERLFILVCAIADSPRFQSFHHYNAGGLSSSLSPLTNQGEWWKKYTDVDPRKGFAARKNPDFEEAKNVHQHTMSVVSVMSLKMLLHAIPPHIEITGLHTDMQGYDFLAIKSAAKSIHRVKNLQTEVHIKDKPYQGVSNDYDTDWVPYMKQMGYNLTKLHGGGKEADAFWERL
jgi:hypothetical protein